jgi:probable poly-beta-1,6-N-acetyl-D-glucosamine export protein
MMEKAQIDGRTAGQIRPFIAHLHAFRGIAIILIVAAHAWSLSIFGTGQLDSTGLTWLFAASETLFHGSTLLFAIISGLLFSQVLHAQSWRRFYRSKVVNVVLPYCLMTLLITFYHWPQANPFASPDFGHQLISNLFYGKASIQYWYIPVLLVLFLLTPALSYLSARPKYLAIVLVIALSPLIITRSPFPDFLKPQTYGYFIGAYVLGLLMGQYYAQWQTWLARHSHSCLLAFMAISTAIFLGYLNGYQASGWFSLRESLFYAQKVLITGLVLLWLKRREDKDNQGDTPLDKGLTLLGNYAFAIYFLHLLFMAAFINLGHNLLAEQREASLLLGFGSLSLVLSILGSIMLSAVIKKLFKQHSRKLIGV